MTAGPVLADSQPCHHRLAIRMLVSSLTLSTGRRELLDAACCYIRIHTPPPPFIEMKALRAPAAWRAKCVRTLHTICRILAVISGRTATITLWVWRCELRRLDGSPGLADSRAVPHQQLPRDLACERHMALPSSSPGRQGCYSCTIFFFLLVNLRPRPARDPRRRRLRAAP